MAWASKDPDSVLDYLINWLPWLTSTDVVSGETVVDTITTSTWVDVPDDLTNESDVKTDSTTTIWLSGGVADQTYYLTNRITTAAGRTQDRTVKLKCKAL